MFRRNHGAILFIVGVVAGLCGYIAVDYRQRQADARRFGLSDRISEATAMQRQAHAAMAALKDVQR